jgi:hypothetical protein
MLVYHKSLNRIVTNIFQIHSSLNIIIMLALLLYYSSHTHFKLMFIQPALRYYFITDVCLLINSHIQHSYLHGSVNLCAVQTSILDTKTHCLNLRTPIEGIFNSEKMKNKNIGLCFAILACNACCNSVARQTAQCMSVLSLLTYNKELDSRTSCTLKPIKF